MRPNCRCASSSPARAASGSLSAWSRKARPRTARWLCTLPINRLRTSAAAPTASSLRRYCSRRNSTFPLTGPSTRAKNRPLGDKKLTQIPLTAQCPIKAGDIIMRPRHTTCSSMCTGRRARTSPSTSITRFSPSLCSHAPSVVTYSVLRSRRISRPPPPHWRFQAVWPARFVRCDLASIRAVGTSRSASKHRTAWAGNRPTV